MIVFICVVISFTLLIFLIYDNVENYRILSKIGDIVSEEKNPIISLTKASSLGVSLKYGPDSDYSTYHQKRAKGQIRTTGEDS